MAKRMPHYRCYFLDPANRVTSFTLLDYATDALAEAEAEKLRSERGCHGVELWNGATMIHHELKQVD
ncbi:MAG TPA: hypothetical protein VKU84_17240 [Stellaceae bacterium]|nr:hypothetical protein [Stellaceae bacterium]